MPRTIAIITREQAKRRGRKVYFTGHPCQHGHVCERFVKRAWCVECARAGLKPERKPPGPWRRREAAAEAARAAANEADARESRDR